MAMCRLPSRSNDWLVKSKSENVVCVYLGPNKQEIRDFGEKTFVRVADREIEYACG